MHLEKDLSTWTTRLYPEMKIFEGRFILLEPLVLPKHAQGLFEMFCAEDVDQRFRYLWDIPPRSIDDIFARFDEAKTLMYRYTIVERNSGKVVGVLRYRDIVPENGTVELGLYFSHIIFKTSGATEAVYLALKHVFDDLGYRRILWGCDNRNEASKVAARRFGFVHEVTFRQDVVVKGERKDGCQFSIIDYDWPIIKQAFEKWLDPKNFDENGNQKLRLHDIRKQIEVEQNCKSPFHALGKVALAPIMPIEPLPPMVTASESKQIANFNYKINCAPPQKKSMEGKYVILEPLDAEKHGNALYDVCSVEPQRFTYLPESPPQDRKDFQEWLLKSQQSQDPLYFVVIDKESGKIAGRQTFSRIRAAHGAIEFGHILWTNLVARKPAATEATYLFAKHVFDDLGYHRLEWKCDRRNTASKNAALRFGFNYEGIFRQFRVRKGTNCDVVWLAMLVEDWPLNKLAFETWLNPSNFDSNGQQIKKLGDIRNEIKIINLKN